MPASDYSLIPCWLAAAKVLETSFDQLGCWVQAAPALQAYARRGKHWGRSYRASSMQHSGGRLPEQSLLVCRLRSQLADACCLLNADYSGAASARSGLAQARRCRVRRCRADVHALLQATSPSSASTRACLLWPLPSMRSRTRMASPTNGEPSFSGTCLMPGFLCCIS